MYIIAKVNQSLVRIFHRPHARCIPHPTHPPSLDHPPGEEYKLWSSSLYKCLQRSVVLSLLGTNIFLITLFSKTRITPFSINLKHQVSRSQEEPISQSFSWSVQII